MCQIAGLSYGHKMSLLLTIAIIILDNHRNWIIFIELNRILINQKLSMRCIHIFVNNCDQPY